MLSYPAITFVQECFTPTGHIICIIGYNDKGFIVNDPYGELMFSPNPEESCYDIYTTGAGLTYSYNRPPARIKLDEQAHSSASLRSS
ncbi:C39 family peptidase [Leptolyngbya sp. AN03gr2]|uniref:C39 family peptidase n=1 Tax=unclassified Leptolyngbya TaxID=2650499 RepID=UPI003D310814